MTSLEIGVISLAFGLLLVLSLLKRDGTRPTLRPIRALAELRKNIELSVEDGSRIQVSLGSGDLLGPQSAAALAGLTLLRQVARIASDSDEPPIATSGNGVLALLSQDTLRKSYQDLGISENYSNRIARITGLTPISYGAGAMPLILDGSVSGSALAGTFGQEAALITAASHRQGAFSFGGSDSLAGQALLFGSADQPLIGEELYAAGAYLGAGPAHDASLQTQDILRWILIIAIIALAFDPLLALFLP